MHFRQGVLALGWFFEAACCRTAAWAVGLAYRPIGGRSRRKALDRRRIRGPVAANAHLLVTARITSNQADLVDLRTRTVVSSFSYSPGPPRFTFSPSSDRLIVAGLLHGSSLAAWDVRPLAPARSMTGMRSVSSCGASRSSHPFGRVVARGPKIGRRSQRSIERHRRDRRSEGRSRYMNILPLRS